MAIIKYANLQQMEKEIKFMVLWKTAEEISQLESNYVDDMEKLEVKLHSSC